jgi:hypothetical protein
MRLAIIALLAASGCVTEVDMPLDEDQDGLLSDLEAELGTDPDSADSDGDGHSDGVEFDSGTDPLDMDDHPYTGGWPMDTNCDSGFSPTGNDVGDITDGFGGVDQHGDQFDSLDFCGKVILIEYGAFW